MPFTSAFSNRRKVVVPSQKVVPPIIRTDWRGLDLTTPYDQVKDNKSPLARNFRIYAEENEDRRVSITSRKGAGFYTTPVGETVDQQQTSTTGAADRLVNEITEWKAAKFTAGATGPLTKIELRLKNTLDASGPIVIELREDNAGMPGNIIAQTGIMGNVITNTYAYVPARFMEAPTVTSGTSYWITAHVQDDGVGDYQWSSTSSATTSLTSNTNGVAWSTTTYSLNIKTYVSSTAQIKGLTRYAPTNNINKTLTAIGTSMYTADDVTGVLSTIATGLNASATDYYFTYADNKVFWVNGFDNLKTWDGTTVSTITHGQLPVAKLATFHKNRLFVVSASDPNKLVFSEEPGNDDSAGNLWYNAYLSTSFIYIPSPKASDPITAIVPFQDNLIVFTRTSKYVLYGSDPGSFTVRQATGKKGAVHQNSVYADENYVYFMADDGIYRFNGAKDEIISDRIQPEFTAITSTNKKQVFITKWNRILRIYYPHTIDVANKHCLLWHTVLEEWMYDTDAYVSRAVAWTDGDDQNQYVEASSVAPTLYYGETQYSVLGKQIDFKYNCKHDNMGNPAMRKRLVRFFPLLEGESRDYTVKVGIDKDRNGTPRYIDLPLTVGGAQIGEFFIGDGTLIGGVNEFKPKRLRASGYAYYWQVSIERKAINNPVRFIGYVLSIRTKRL